MARTHEMPPTVTNETWQQWAKKRAQQAPALERVHEIARKIQVNVTQRLLDERSEA